MKGMRQHSKWDKEEIAVTKVVKNILNEYKERRIYEKQSNAQKLGFQNLKMSG